MKIVIVSDAWTPQTNGVVVTLRKTAVWLERLGFEVAFVTPQGMRSFGLPTYKEIRLAWRPARSLRQQLIRHRPDYIHIATEGPLGCAARRYCLRNGLMFSTSYHTRFPQYVRARFPVPEAVTYAWLRRFHDAGQCTMVGTRSLRLELEAHGFRNTAIWSRGVDTGLFRPYDRSALDLPRPISMYMGRVAVEKNIDAFLQLDLPGTKVIVGDGPALRRLQHKYPDTVFVGYRYGEDLARTVSAADVFVFPSRTDTFGLVLLEALACGVPVAAYPVMGPIDVIEQGVSGVLDEDLQRATLAALNLDRDDCRAAALQRTWEAATREFVGNLQPAHARARTAA